MAEIAKISPESQRVYDDWVASRPPAIQEMIRTHPPIRLYRNTIGQRVTIQSYAEDGTVRVIVSGEFNRCMYDRSVFGVPLADLVECDLPGEDELVGTVLTDADDIQAYIDMTRPVVLAGRMAEKKDSN